MNIAESFLANYEKPSDLDPFRPDGHWVSLQLTPRYRTSAHVVILLVDSESAEPKLVLKAARFAKGQSSLLREAEVLRSVHSTRPGGFPSIPKVLSCSEFNGVRVLLETGLPGRPLNQSLVRREFDVCRDAVVSWVTEMHLSTLREPTDLPGASYERHAGAPLAVLERWLPRERELLESARRLVEPLRRHPMPRVFEHGDLSAPNLLLHEGKLQVVDWELGVRDGLPACDLFFGLTYLATARAGDDRTGVREAFRGQRAWAAPLIHQYQRALGLHSEVTRALFVLCWIRYLARLTRRLPEDLGESAAVQGEAWLSGNRYVGILDEAIRISDTLVPDSLSAGGIG